jgi:hypothetical protein
MPNWCENDLTVFGPDPEMPLLHMQSENCHFDFNRVIPYPKKYQDLDDAAQKWEEETKGQPWEERPKDGYNQGGYDWCIENWGTKWNALPMEPYMTFPDGAAIISFSTAWSPPIPVIRALSEKFPLNTFALEYFEAGMGFCGEVVVQDGVVLSDHYSDDYDGGRGG